MTLKTTFSRNHRASFACVLSLPLVLAALGSTGCATWRDSTAMKIAKKVDIPDGIPWKDQKPKSGVPRRMVVTWTDAVRQQSGAEAERGFGGRIFFYDHDEASPIKVEGQLVVYAFDEKDRLPTDNRPTKRYVFPAGQFVQHASESELGVSYSVWLPWGKSGGEQTDVSLIARFEPLKGGNLIVSEQTRQRLPGLMGGPETMIAGQPPQGQVTTTSAMAEVAPSSTQAVHTAGYQSIGAASTTSSNNGMQTTTIKLPSKTRR